MDESAPFPARLRDSDYVYVIGVAGDSGSGKTTFTSTLRHLIGEEVVATITLDDYHIYSREERKERGITPLSPSANDIARLEDDISRLKKFLPVEKRVYDHQTGRITGPFPFTPRKVLVIEGLHALFTEKLRQLCDFSLFVDPDPDVRREWKIKRDTATRGYTEQEVRAEMEQRARDYRAYIEPQKESATGVIGISFSRFGRNLGWEKNIYRISLHVKSGWGFFPPAGLPFRLDAVASSPGDPFGMTFWPAGWEGRERIAFEFDGVFPAGSGKDLGDYLQKTTGRDPWALLPEGQVLTPTLLVQLVLCGIIITHRLSLPPRMGPIS
ncbi:MAG: phosphoribulokinase [Methanolinea sp.]|nr:phosphoribulokinase [Methanolinea sp.]